MEVANKSVKLTTSQGKLVQYREQSDLAFQLLIKSQLLTTPLDMDMLMTFSLTPVPASLGTPDGFYNKTKKLQPCIICWQTGQQRFHIQLIHSLFRMEMQYFTPSNRSHRDLGKPAWWCWTKWWLRKPSFSQQTATFQTPLRVLSDFAVVLRSNCF